MATSKNTYDEAIARAKAALESYSAEAEELARLYENAKSNAQAAYESQRQQTSAQAAESRRKADIDMQRTERNLDQRLASRGLAFSGENAQTRLDLLVALRNQLAGIDSDERAQLADLDQGHADRTHELDMAYASDRADRAKQLASLNADLAAAEANKAAAEEAAKATEAAKAAAAAASAASKGNGGSSSAKPEPTDEEKAADILKGPLQLGDLFKNAASGLLRKFQGLPVDLNVKSNGKDPVVPEVSARSLATQLVKAAGSAGKISSSREQAALASLLASLLDSYKLDSAYYKELMLNLRSLGYRPDYAQTVDANVEKLQSASRDVYETMHRRFISLYRRVGMSESDAGRDAEQEARYQQIRYLYTHATDEDEFEYAADALQLTGYLSDFYDRVAKEKPKVKLGSEL